MSNRTNSERILEPVLENVLNTIHELLKYLNSIERSSSTIKDIAEKNRYDIKRLDKEISNIKMDMR